MGFGVWGLGFGVWGLGFGVWGLGFWGFGVLGFWGFGIGMLSLILTARNRALIGCTIIRSKDC